MFESGKCERVSPAVSSALIVSSNSVEARGVPDGEETGNCTVSGVSVKAFVNELSLGE